MTGLIELTLTPEMIEETLREWEERNPGRDAVRELSPEKFADLVVEKLLATARLVPKEEIGL